MVDNRNENFLKTGERPLEPADARKHVIDSFVGAATVALGAAYPDVVSDPSLAPFMGGHVGELFARRDQQRLGIQQVAGPAMQAAEVGTPPISPDNYLDRLAEDVRQDAVAEISPAGWGAVMESTVNIPVNDFREAA